MVEALVALDGSVPSAAAIAAWVWSRWHATGGYFDDEYSMNWSTLQDGTAWLASNRYSPVVATGCALDILALLRQPVPAAVNDSVRAFVLSCHDPLAGTFKGRPGAVEPTLQDAAWAIDALWRTGSLYSIDAGACAGYIASLVSPSIGLFQLHVPFMALPAPEYTSASATIPATRLAVEALDRLGRLGSIDVAALRGKIMACYDPARKHFVQDPYTSKSTVLATADALRSLAAIGLPASLTAAELAAIAEEYARKQLPGGGWAMEDGRSLAATAQCARAITELVKVAGTTGTIDIARVKSVFALSMASNPAAGMAAYCPYPSSHPGLPAACELVLLARARGLLDPEATAAALALARAAVSDGSGTYPREYPGNPVVACCTGGEWRTCGTGGIEQLARLVALKDAVAAPFTLADLNAIALALGGLQYKDTAIPGIRGLCIYRHDATPTLGMPTVAPRAASLEATHAAARVVDTLRGYGNGSWFVPSRFFDLGLLCARLALAYREAGQVAWFEREHPASFQQPAGLDSARLRDTRLVAEILAMTGSFSHAAIASTVNIAKVA
nr:hypothetical protein [Candidatus Sigynarchaeum springense]